MKITFYQISEDTQEKYLRENLPDHELTFTDKPLDSSTTDLAKDAQVVSVFVGSDVNAQLIAQLNAGLVTTRSTGFDHINLEATKDANITVCNVPFYGENTVAEHTMALLLALSRRVPASIKRVKEGSFNYEGLRGWDLKNKTMGIIGGGHIGTHVARMAVGFQMEVLVYDLHPDEDLAREIGFSYAELRDLLAQSDVISLHLPLNTNTQHFLSSSEFAQMKEGVYLLNTARGGLIDTDALVEALESGKVAGAGLDVLEEEEALDDELELLADASTQKDRLLTVLQDHSLIEMPNVLITPHNAFNSQEAVLRILDTTVENIKAFEAGNPQNVVQ